MRAYRVATERAEWCRTLHEAKIRHLSLENPHEVPILAYQWDGKRTPTNENILHVYALIMGKYTKKQVKTGMEEPARNLTKNAYRLNSLPPQY